MCGDCQNLKRFLQENHIDFHEISLDNDSAGEAEMKQLTGNRIVPTLVFSKGVFKKQSEVLIGFEQNEQRIKTLIGWKNE